MINQSRHTSHISDGIDLTTDISHPSNPEPGHKTMERRGKVLWKALWKDFQK